MSELLQAFRRWWFDNEVSLSAQNVYDRLSAMDIGGPSVDFEGCSICQMSEWESRDVGENRYQKHKCEAGTSDACRERCEKQGDDAWTMWHQDFSFAEGVDPALNAPKGALLLQDCASQYEWFRKRTSSAGLATFRQKMAYVGTYDAEARLSEKHWERFDWCWFVNKGEIELLPKPPVPMVLYCHDAWRGNKQEVIDHYRPEILLTPFPTLWRDNFRIPDGTRMVFTPAMASPFFARPNLDDARKRWDLLVIGALGSDFYEPRRALNERLKALPSRFRVEHNHATGAHRARWYGPLDDGDHCYMNKWNDRLGAARFVIFGPCAGKAAPMVLIKYYECLASGAIPIMPNLHDMDLLGVHPMVHFIPFDVAGENMKALEYILDHYADYRYIAENAVEWHKKHAHRMIFETFENMVRSITGERYPARLV